MSKEPLLRKFLLNILVGNRVARSLLGNSSGRGEFQIQVGELLKVQGWSQRRVRSSVGWLLLFSR